MSECPHPEEFLPGRWSVYEFVRFTPANEADRGLLAQIMTTHGRRVAPFVLNRHAGPFHEQADAEAALETCRVRWPLRVLVVYGDAGPLLSEDAR